MKKCIIAAVMILLGALHTELAAQLSYDSLQSSRERNVGLEFLQKSRTQTTMGWILLGVGSALVVIIANKPSDEIIPSSGTLVMVIGGGLACLGSIPLFISGAKNKKRAAIHLRDQNISTSSSTGTRIISLGVSIPFGR